jgi:hypothetical protein
VGVAIVAYQNLADTCERNGVAEVLRRYRKAIQELRKHQLEGDVQFAQLNPRVTDCYWAQLRGAREILKILFD